MLLLNQWGLDCFVEHKNLGSRRFKPFQIMYDLTVVLFTSVFLKLYVAEFKGFLTSTEK